MKRSTVHFTASQLREATNPVTVNLIGAGGTGSRMIGLLAELNFLLLAGGHPGLQVRLFDDDKVTSANLYRQKFIQSDIGKNKAQVLIDRTNRAYAVNWKAVPEKFALDKMAFYPPYYRANLYISCVDKVDQRFFIAEILHTLKSDYHSNNGYYWLDLGNGKNTGQGILSTLCDIEQPSSDAFLSVARLPMVTEEFNRQLRTAPEDDLPSCSLADALKKQNLYINAGIAIHAAALVQELMTAESIDKRGFFLNLLDGVCQPIYLKPTTVLFQKAA